MAWAIFQHGKDNIRINMRRVAIYRRINVPGANWPWQLEVVLSGVKGESHLTYAFPDEAGQLAALAAMDDAAIGGNEING